MELSELSQSMQDALMLRRIPTEGGDVSSVTPVVVSGLPGWLECTAFPVELRQRVQEELEILGLVQSPVVALLWPASASVTKKKTLRRGYSTASALRPSRPNKLCEESGISLSIRLVSDSPWPLVKSVALDCNMEFGRDIRQTTSHISDADWAEDVTSARQHWQQQLLAGLSKYTENLEVQLPRKALSSTSQTFASRTSPEESLWRKHGPKALAILLSELIVNGAMHDAATHLEGTMLETMRSNLPFFPEGPLDFEEHFPPLQLSDAYIETEKQRSPELFLRLAAVVWTAASHGVAALDQALGALRKGSVPLDRVALNTPVMYRSGGRSRSLTGPLLMFVVDQMTLHQSSKHIVQAVVAGNADVNSSYVLFPIGKHKAIAKFPVLCLAGNRRALDFAEALLERKADANREITLNYFPNGGNPLWSAVWGSNNAMIRLLLGFGDANVNIHAWHPDAPPLTGQPREVQLLSLASTALDSEHVHLLLECNADFHQELSSTFALCHADVSKLLASHVAYRHPEALVQRCDELEGTCGIWIDWAFQEIARDDAAKRRFRVALDRASVLREAHDSLIRFTCDLIQRLPSAASELLDGICLQTPKVQEPARHPLRTRCLFQASNFRTAYITETVWKPDGTRFQDTLAPPGPESRPCCGLGPSVESMDFCDVLLVGFPGLIDGRVLRALRSLPRRTLIPLVQESIVFQGLIEYIWTSRVRLYHYVKSLQTVIQLGILLLWWQTRSQQLVAVYWGLFTGILAAQLLSLVLCICRLELPYILAVFQSGYGLRLVLASWGAWYELPLSEYKSPLAVNVALCITVIVYDCRVLKPFGLPVGQSLLPILNAAGSLEFAAMSAVISLALLATFLYVCIEFEEDLGFPSNAFQTWQTLIVGEPTLVDARISPQDVIRYLSVSACFLVCNTVLMNIFINVTGASYLQERASVVGTFAVERLRICVASTSVSTCVRHSVMGAFTLMWSLWLTYILLTAEFSGAVPVIVAIVTFYFNFFCAGRAAKAAVADLDSEFSELRYLWICRRANRPGASVASQTRKPGQQSALEQVRALQARFGKAKDETESVVEV
eukprot:s1121_g19.t1